ERRRVEDAHHVARRPREAAEMSARRDRTDEDAAVLRMTLHADAIAEDRAARVRARRIDAQDAHALALRARRGDESIRERALARARIARHADDVRFPRAREDLLQEVEPSVVAVVDVP